MALLGPHSEPVLVWRLDVAGVEAVGLHGRSVFAQPLSFRAGPLPHQAAGQGTKVLPRTKSMEKPTRRRLACPGGPHDVLVAPREAGFFTQVASGLQIRVLLRPPDPGPPEASRRFRFRWRRGCFRRLRFPSTLEGLDSYTAKWRMETPRRTVHGKETVRKCFPPMIGSRWRRRRIETMPVSHCLGGQWAALSLFLSPAST